MEKMDQKRLSLVSSIKVRRYLLMTTFFIRYFFIGAEYTVILPSVLLYMKSLGATKAFNGLVIAAYPVAAVISLPLVGYLYDKTKRTREMLIVLNLFQMAGNLIYALPFSKWLPLLGRFVAGVGDSFIALVVGEVAFLYSKSKRMGMLSILELGRVAGLTLGPILNFFTGGKSVHLGKWRLDSSTLPGVIMAFCWLFMQIVTLFCAFNLTKELTESRCSREDDPGTDLLIPTPSSDGLTAIAPNVSNYQSICCSEKDLDTSSDNLRELVDNSENKVLISPDIDERNCSTSPDIDMKKDTISSDFDERKGVILADNDSERRVMSPDVDEKTCLIPSNIHEDRNVSSPDDSARKDPISPDISMKKDITSSDIGEKEDLIPPDKTYWESCREILGADILTLLFADLVLSFTQDTLEVMLPYITEYQFGWTPQLTGMFYMVGGIILFIIFIGIYLMGSRCLKDVYLKLLSLVLTFSAVVMVILQGVLKSRRTQITVIWIAVLFVFASVPFNLVCSKSILTRVIAPENQGFVQGILVSITKFAFVIAPLLSGIIFEHKTLCCGIIAFFCFLAMILVIFNLGGLARREERVTSRSAKQ